MVAVTGLVKLRDESTRNPNIDTGEVELVPTEMRLLNESKLPPFLPGEKVISNEELRLKYRYVDLRRPEMQSTSRPATRSPWPFAITWPARDSSRSKRRS